MKFEAVRAFAMSLPDVTEEPHFHMTSFRVKGKIFATAPPERAHVHIFVDEHQSRAWADQDPAAYEVLMWGKSMAGLRVTLEKARPDDVQELLRESYARKAPAKKAAAKRVAPKTPAAKKAPAKKPGKAPRRAS